MKGERIYHRKYRRQTKKWDVSPVLKSKQYNYIPELMNSVRLLRSQTSVTLRHKRVLAEDHPAQQQPTIAHVNPNPTDELVWQKRSRFH